MRKKWCKSTKIRIFTIFIHHIIVVIYRPNTFGKSFNISLIREKVWYHSWPLEWISTLQHDSPPRKWSQQHWHQTKSRLIRIQMMSYNLFMEAINKLWLNLINPSRTYFANNIPENSLIEFICNTNHCTHRTGRITTQSTCTGNNLNIWIVIC